MPIIKAILADITTLEVDIVVNAANETLLGGGGVDGAIHRAAGPSLLEECRRHPGCFVGGVVLTAGHRLPARHVIHTVGPRWRDGQSREVERLSSCYGKSIELAESLEARSMAFPCISTGVYRFPSELAARTAVASVLGAISEPSSLTEIIFCCFKEHDLSIYREILDSMFDG